MKFWSFEVLKFLQNFNIVDEVFKTSKWVFKIIIKHYWESQICLACGSSMGKNCKIPWNTDKNPIEGKIGPRQKLSNQSQIRETEIIFRDEFKNTIAYLRLYILNRKMKNRIFKKRASNDEVLKTSSKLQNFKTSRP